MNGKKEKNNLSIRYHHDTDKEKQKQVGTTIASPLFNTKKFFFVFSHLFVVGFGGFRGYERYERYILKFK